MAIDFDILEECGTTNARLREFFTAEMPSKRRESKMDPKVLKQIEKDVAGRKKFEQMLSTLLQEHVLHSLTNHKMYSAVDLAWDSTPINKLNFPLMQYAQGRIQLDSAVKALQDCPGGDTYIKKDKDGKATSIDLPKFTEMNINLIRSVIGRRVAALVDRYSLWPHFNYEPRDMTAVGKFRGDLTSQWTDIMADAYGYKHFDEQVGRDMLIYPNGCVAFPRCSWEREVQWVKDRTAPELDDGKIRKKTVVTKEGIAWVNPHPSRVFWDNNYPLATLNTDTGCEHIGYWDVTRWGDIADNPDYFNRNRVTFSADTAAWFTNYSMYFQQYFDRVIPPALPEIQGDMAAANDRKNNIGIYSGELKHSSTFFSHIWMKVNPREWAWGTYPYPVWVHLKAAGDSTVVYADIMPSSPAAVYQFNCNDGRQINISLAHELMQFQDQLTNLYSQLLATIKADLFSVAVLNTDIFPDTDEGKKVREQFRQIMSGKAYFTEPQILEASFERLSQVLGGREITADMVFKFVRSAPNTAITAIFEAISHVIQMADRLFVMSPHELGQSASHEITASESNAMASSTDTIYNFIARGFDKGRAAQKRICFESTIACASDDMELPVVNRYAASVITKAGFEVKETDDESSYGEVPFVTVMGHKDGLRHEYIFTSRDGSDRISNSQSAQVLVQLMQAIGALHPAMQNAIIGGMGKSKLYEWMNSIFRLADQGIDLKLELKPGENDTLLVEDDQQVMQIIQRLGEAVKKNNADIQQMQQMGAQLAHMVKGGPAKESISIAYKDAPEDIKRQMETAAGFKPSNDPSPNPTP